MAETDTEPDFHGLGGYISLDSTATGILVLADQYDHQIHSINPRTGHASVLVGAKMEDDVGPTRDACPVVDGSEFRFESIGQLVLCNGDRSVFILDAGVLQYGTLPELDQSIFEVPNSDH